jgi:hypothetical protein
LSENARIALPGPGAVEEPEQQRHRDHRHDDGDPLRRAEGQPLLEAGQVAEGPGGDDEAFAVGKALVIDADDEADDPVHDEHHPD